MLRSESSRFSDARPPAGGPLDLRRLFLLRNTAIVTELVAIVVAVRLLDLALPMAPLLAIVAFHAIVNVVTAFRLRHGRHVGPTEFALQLAIDTLVFAALLYFAGGYTNPFVSLFLLPLVIAASILPTRYMWAMAALTIGCYTVLMFFYVPLPPMGAGHHGGSAFDLHVLGMWFSFLLSAALVVLFVVRMSASLRERDRALARMREKALRDEHLVELGTLAAGAAHELGTPLATMAVLTNELCREHGGDPQIREQAEILRQQVDRCKAILSNLSASAGQARAEGGAREPLDRYLEGVVTQWRQLRSGARAECRIEGEGPPPPIVADKTLTQAIVNLLNNAADAAGGEAVELRGGWDGERLVIEVLDRGPGAPEPILRNPGAPFVTTKPHGHGLGLYLARSVVERYGGTLTLAPREGGGTRAHIELPRHLLEVE